jgi:hypothetical protein
MRRVAGDLERVAREGNPALLALAARLRARCLGGEVPADVALPTLWRPDPRAGMTPRPPDSPARPVPELEPGRVRREQQIGFGLGLAQGAAQIHLAAGGRV